jgi:hypothetical protein
MDVCEPRLRHRGFFLHSSEAESDSGEHENPEGFAVRVRTRGHQTSHKSASVHQGATGTRFGGRSHRTDPLSSETHPEIRSGSVTGSRQRAHLPR